MARESVIKGSCAKPGCKRRAKLKYDCAKCEEERGFHVLRACGFHREQVHEQMRDHLIENHPRAVQAALMAQDTPQKFVARKRLRAWMLITAVAFLVALALTWLVWLKR